MRTAAVPIGQFIPSSTKTYRNGFFDAAVSAPLPPRERAQQGVSERRPWQAVRPTGKMEAPRAGYHASNHVERACRQSHEADEALGKMGHPKDVDSLIARAKVKQAQREFGPRFGV